MKKVLFLLYPFSIIYGSILKLRNILFDKKIIRSHIIPWPSIGVGNLSVGGTGKSVVISYLMELFYERIKTGVLSRGYKRNTKGVVVAHENCSAAILGDEPFQFFKRFPKNVVVVAEKRQKGIDALLDQKIDIDLLLLDDVFQHRYVTPSLMILTMSYQAPFYNDYPLPMGRLREFQSGKKRADTILVTKCPRTLDENQKEQIRKRIDPHPLQKVYFTTVKYSKTIHNSSGQLLLSTLTAPFLLVTGVAQPEPLVSHLKELNLVFEHCSFSDHHAFTELEIEKLKVKKKQGIVLTTEKDFYRLLLKWESEDMYYLPIQLDFIFHHEEIEFKNRIEETLKNV